MTTSHESSSFSAIAGNPALDLVNTVDWRLSAAKRTDRLSSFDDVVAWTAQFGLISETDAAELIQSAHADPVIAERELERVRAMREAIYRAAYLLPASAESLSPEKEGSLASGAELVAAEYAKAIAAGWLNHESEAPEAQWTWQFTSDLVLPRRRIALIAMQLLTAVTPSALGQCADEECGWIFVDTSPRRNRRWCVASDCGNRNRVRKHNERARAGADAPTKEPSRV